MKELIFGKAININKCLKAFSNWWTVEHEININIDNLTKNSKIKVYLWNTDKQQAYVDNFTVEIFGY